MKTIRLSLATLAVGAAVASLPAQSRQPFSIQASGVFTGVGGESFEGLKAGPGFDAQLRARTKRLSLGLGYQLSHHGSDRPGSTMSLSGPFAEPRYLVTAKSQWTTYLAARFALLKQSYSASDFDGSTTGSAIYGGGGVTRALGARTYLDLGMAYGYTTFKSSQATEHGTGTEFPLPSGSGKNFVTHVGLSLGLGH